MRKAVRYPALWLAIAVATLLAACATLVPSHPPRIDVVGVSLDRVVGADAFFSVAVTVSNPNDRDIVIDALDGTLSIEGQVVAKGQLRAPVNVPAHGSANAGFAARAGMDSVLLAVAKAMQRGAAAAPSGGPPSLHFVLEGRAGIAGGASVPFSRSGDLGKSN